MTEQKNDWSNLRCLYAEDLGGKRFALTIASVRDTPRDARLFCQTGYSEAWDISFSQKDKDGRTPYIQIPKPNAFGKATGLLRTYKAATGGEPCADHVGKQITLISVQSKKSATGEAIRIAIPERQA